MFVCFVLFAEVLDEFIDFLATCVFLLTNKSCQINPLFSDIFMVTGKNKNKLNVAHNICQREFFLLKTATILLVMICCFFFFNYLGEKLIYRQIV